MMMTQVATRQSSSLPAGEGLIGRRVRSVRAGG